MKIECGIDHENMMFSVFSNIENKIIKLHSEEVLALCQMLCCVSYEFNVNAEISTLFFKELLYSTKNKEEM